jgi:hypothetical protein
MGERCTQYPRLGQPQKVRSTAADNLCEPCKRAGFDALEASPDSESEYAKLFRAALVILDTGITDEDKVIPTLVFAANSDRVPSLESARESLTTDGDHGAISEESYAWFRTAFDYFAVLSEVRRGVPILRELPAVIWSLKDDQGYIKEIAIDVFKRSVRQDDIAKPYAEHLKKEGVSYDPDRGEIAYKFHDDSQESFLRMLVRPETRSVDSADARILPITAGQPRFPEPQVVAGVFDTLRGSRSKGAFPGYLKRLAGRERGPRRKDIEKLTLACVAWYVGGRGELVRRPEMRPRVAKLLNRRILATHSTRSLSEHSWDSSELLWETVKDVESSILRLERAVERRAETRVVP